MDMLLHHPNSFAALASMFEAMPQLVQDLYSHYRYAAAPTKKLNFLGPDHEQLPYPLWDPKIWSNLRQWGPAQKHKLVYVATDQQNQQQVIKFTKQYGWEVHRAWAAPDRAPKLLSSPYQVVAGRWQQVQVEYMSSSAVQMESLPSSAVQMEYLPSSTVQMEYLPSSAVQMKYLLSSTVQMEYLLLSASRWSICPQALAG
ncbi:hypothetical protein WJX77_011807 [Trebouxia sp. C0004]